MSHAINLHDGSGIAITDPSLGILLAYGSTVPTDTTVGYAPGCVFLKTNGTTFATVVHVNVGTKASSLFVADFVSAATVQTLSNKTFVAPVLGSASASSLVASGGIVSTGATGAGLGYSTGAGGTVLQATDRTTGVTLNKLTGQITTQATSLAAAGEVSFTVTNSTVAIGDVVVAAIQSGPTTPGSTQVSVTTVAAGSFQLTLNNLHASTADTGAAIINFAVFKAVAA